MDGDEGLVRIAGFGGTLRLPFLQPASALPDMRERQLNHRIGILVQLHARGGGRDSSPSPLRSSARISVAVGAITATQPV
jgi:hypothetical protein